MTTINQRRQALAQLIQERLDALSQRKSLVQVARELGWKSDRTIHLYAAGETFVPLDHAIPLAHALELDPGPFFRAALECFMQLPEGLQITFVPAPIASVSEGATDGPKSAEERV